MKYDILDIAENLGRLFVFLNMVVFFYAAYTPFTLTLQLSSINLGYVDICLLCVLILDVGGLRYQIKELKENELLKIPEK